VSATAGQAQDQRDLAERLGVKPGHVVQEIGYDDDCDEQLRDSVAKLQGVELVDEDYDDVVDGVLLWWRDGDGDLVDALVDALTPLADGGYILLLTPKSGREGHVEPSEIGRIGADRRPVADLDGERRAQLVRHEARGAEGAPLAPAAGARLTPAFVPAARSSIRSGGCSRRGAARVQSGCPAFKPAGRSARHSRRMAH
jgi:hypothetical protein